MSKRPKPHVQRDLVQPLAKFSIDMVEGLQLFDRYISGISPIDGVGCLGLLKKASRDMRDAANEFVATVDAQAQRVRWMKGTKRKKYVRL